MINLLDVCLAGRSSEFSCLGQNSLALLEKLWLHFDLTADLRNVNNITLNSVTWS